MPRQRARRRNAEDRQAMPMPVNSAPQTTTWATPRPKISRAQRPQPRRLHFETDHEQQHHHAELGDVKDRPGSVKKSEPERADHQPGREIPEHGPEAGAPKDGHCDDGRAEKSDNLDEIAFVAASRHARLPETEKPRDLVTSTLRRDVHPPSAAALLGEA